MSQARPGSQEVRENRARPEKPSTRPIWGWALYDWANSAYATTVMAGFFPIFFKQYWSAGAEITTSTARLGLANFLAGIAVAVLAPVLGGLADRTASKKRFLLAFAALGVMATASLSQVGQGAWPWAVLAYALASMGFAGSCAFYDALLVGVAPPRELARVSSFGFSMGYLGGGLLGALGLGKFLVRGGKRGFR